MTASPVHVRPREDGSWTVELEGSERPLSVHADATEAASSAAAQAEALGGADVLVHDRYHCVHVIPQGHHGPRRHVPPSRTTS